MAQNRAQDAAVLIPVYRDSAGDLQLVLIRRAQHGLHAGQIALPGGKFEPEDISPLETALRETYEEIGLDRDRIDILAALPPVETLTTGFRIHPFLGRITPPEEWSRQPEEVDEVLVVGIRSLLEAAGEDTIQFPTWPEPRRIAFYRIGQDRLWGATYRILQPLLPRLLDAEWPI